MNSWCELKCYLSVPYPARHRNTPKFIKFNLEYSGFYSSFIVVNGIFSKIVYYPLFTVFTVHLYIRYYNIGS